MMLNVRAHSDFSTGAMLTIQFPEADLDLNALYTLEKDWPEFLVPFRYRNIDGQIECTYQLGERIKLQYRYGKRSPADCAVLWQQILQPLLDCDDWFLKPFSFVLDERYLYLDSDGKNISYLYVPAKTDCSDYQDLKKMATAMADQNPVTDHDLEIKILRAVMQDFNPKSFLKMLQGNEGKKQSIEKAAEKPVVKTRAPMNQESVLKAVTAAPVKAEEQKPFEIPVANAQDEIVIKLDSKGITKKKEKTGGLFGGRKDKADKAAPVKEKQKRHGLFGKDKNASKEILLAAQEEVIPVEKPQKPLAPVYNMKEEDYDVTMLDSEVAGAHFRLIGDPDFPKCIEVPIAEGKTFTIGRFDVSVGEKLSDFEFDKKAKAVSRHHAAIERTQEGYWLIDQSSRAGTFLNNNKLTPGVAYLLENGVRVSFGTGGADYIWED